MELIAFTEKEVKEILGHLTEIKDQISKLSNQKMTTEKWLDIQETCILLKISKRTCQNYRDHGLLPFSQIGNKVYFKATDIELFLLNHYNGQKIL